MEFISGPLTLIVSEIEVPWTVCHSFRFWDWGPQTVTKPRVLGPGLQLCEVVPMFGSQWNEM